MKSGLRVGGNVDGWCTRCKLILAHTIEVLVGSDIKRVCCNTCKGKHQHKAHEPGTKVATSKTPRTSAAKAVKPNHYAALLESSHSTEAIPYSTQGHFALGNVLNHSMFGVGIVSADKGGNKIEVIFPTGSKTLIHAQV